MTEMLEDLIRARAREIWEREGRPVGCEAEHWERGRKEIEAARYGSEAPSEATAPESPPRKG